MILAQLTDTHVVRAGKTYFGRETDRFLADAIEALNALDPLPDLVVVTGDLVQSGFDAEYERFVAVMETLRVPYVVVPGNHDDRDRMRAHLPAATFGDSRHERVRFAIDACGVRLIGLDGTSPGRWPAGSLDAESLAWLETTLESEPGPTIVCVHQPPFRTGLHYLDALGYRGRRRFAAAIAKNPNVGLVLCGHVHCVRTARIGSALALSAPSTAPQRVPELFERRALTVRFEAPGFALHRYDGTRFTSTIHRREGSGRYVVTAEYPSPDANGR